MITFITHLRVKPGCSPAFEELMTHVHRMTREYEPGVAYYDFGKSVDDADTYVVVEVYRDRLAHAAHMETDWVKDSLPLSHSLVDGGFDIRQYVSPGTEPAVRQLKEPRLE